MGETLLISNVTIADSENASIFGDIYIEDGKIKEVSASIKREADNQLDATGKDWIIVPGFIDIHIHGSSGFDAMDATPQALDGLASALPREGTTSF